MQVTIISYTVKSCADIRILTYMLESPDEDKFIDQLKAIKQLNGYDVTELLVDTLDGGVLDYVKDRVVFPRLGLKFHASKLVHDSRYGKVIKSAPIDMDFWLED